jgi:hypothetical protein
MLWLPHRSSLRGPQSPRDPRPLHGPPLLHGPRPSRLRSRRQKRPLPRLLR